MLRMPQVPPGATRTRNFMKPCPRFGAAPFFDLIGQLEVLQPNTTQARLRRSEKFRKEEMRSGAGSRVVPKGLADLVHQRIPREGLLKEETILQEVFVAPVVFQIA